MDTWTLQKGYPLVTIKRTGNQLHLTQNWFLLDPENTVQGTAEYDSYRWYVAFTHTTKEEQNWEMETRPNWFFPNQEERKIYETLRKFTDLCESAKFRFLQICESLDLCKSAKFNDFCSSAKFTDFCNPAKKLTYLLF